MPFGSVEAPRARYYVASQDHKLVPVSPFATPKAGPRGSYYPRHRCLREATISNNVQVEQILLQPPSLLYPARGWD